jgi:hypothetical protein
LKSGFGLSSDQILRTRAHPDAGNKVPFAVAFRWSAASSVAEEELGRLAEYEAGPYKGSSKKIREAFAAIVPDDADVSAVAAAIVKVVDALFAKRPFRVHIDPTQDGAEVAFAVIDRLRTEMLHRVGLDELLTAAKI